MKIAKFFIGFLIICAFTMFATANLQKIQVNFLFDNQPLLGYHEAEQPNNNGSTETIRTPREVPLFLLLFVTFGLGFLVSWILSAGLVRKHKKNAKTLTKQCNAVTQELDELRNLPVQPPDGTPSDKTLPDKAEKKALPLD